MFGQGWASAARWGADPDSDLDRSVNLVEGHEYLKGGFLPAWGIGHDDLGKASQKVYHFRSFSGGSLGEGEAFGLPGVGGKADKQCCLPGVSASSISDDFANFGVSPPDAPTGSLGLPVPSPPPRITPRPDRGPTQTGTTTTIAATTYAAQLYVESEGPDPDFAHLFEQSHQRGLAPVPVPASVRMSQHPALKADPSALVAIASPDGKILGCTARFSKSTGYTQEELSHLTFFNLLESSELQDTFELVAGLVHSTSSQGFTKHVQRKPQKRAVFNDYTSVEELLGLILEPPTLKRQAPELWADIRSRVAQGSAGAAASVPMHVSVVRHADGSVHYLRCELESGEAPVLRHPLSARG